MEKLDVIASFDWMDKEEKIGSLGYEYLRGSDVFSFEFDKTWLKRYPKIDFGCDLRPYTGVQYSPVSYTHLTLPTIYSVEFSVVALLL